MFTCKQHRKHFNLWKRWIIPAVIVLCLTTTLCGQVTITGPTESLAGDLVVLSVEQKECGVMSVECGVDESLTPHSKLQTPNFIWTVIPDDVTAGKYHIADGGRTLVFSSRLEGTYHFILSARNGTGVIAVTHKLDNRSLGPAPVPEPIPIPTPEPEPAPLPDPDHAAIGKFAGEKAKQLVKSQFFDREKNAIGEAFLATARQIESDDIESCEDARTGLRKNTLTYLNGVSKESASNWQTWNTALGDELARYKLDNLAEIGKVYKTIGVTLVEVKDCPDGNCHTPVKNYRRW